VESQGFLASITTMERDQFTAEGLERGRKASRSLLQVAYYGLLSYLQAVCQQRPRESTRDSQSVHCFRCPNYNRCCVDFARVYILQRRDENFGMKFSINIFHIEDSYEGFV
jgi:hypothetical protein